MAPSSLASAAIDVVVVLYGCAEFVPDALRSLHESTVRPLRVWLVDNGAGDGSLGAALAAWPEAEIVSPGRNLGFGGGCNLVIPRGNAPWILLLNPDARLEPGAVDRLLAELESHRELAAAGPLVLREDDGSVDTAGLEYLAPGFTRDRARGKRLDEAPRSDRVEALCGAVLLLRRAALDAVGRSAEPFWGGLFLYNEDVELCHALRAGGYELAYVAEARALHRVGASGGPRPRLSAIAARNRVLTLLVHGTLRDLGRPLVVLRWLRRLWLDAPKLVRSVVQPEDRRAVLRLWGEVAARRREVSRLRQAAR